MNRKLKLLGIPAHHDDESLGFGGTFAKCASEAIETCLVTATAEKTASARRASAGKCFSLQKISLAEEEGFEPPVPVRVRRFSRPLP